MTTVSLGVNEVTFAKMLDAVPAKKRQFLHVHQQQSVIVSALARTVSDTPFVSTISEENRRVQRQLGTAFQGWEPRQCTTVVLADAEYIQVHRLKRGREE